MGELWRVDKTLEDSEAFGWVREQLGAFNWAKVDWITVHCAVFDRVISRLCNGRYATRCNRGPRPVLRRAMREDDNGRIRTAPMTGKLLVRIVLVILVLALAGCGLVELRTSEKNAVGSGTTQVGNPNEASQALQQLEVTPPGSMSGYSRESFDHWSRANDFGWDAPESSCDAREAALIRDGENVEVGSGCKVTSGKWHDPYTDQAFTDPSDIDTDHIVALGNAWRSGASAWDDAERERYANDPEVLLSVEDNANQSKGDKGPEAWKPPNEAVWCDFAERWISIKAKYDLSINPEEKEALTQMLDGCAGG